MTGAGRARARVESRVPEDPDIAIALNQTNFPADRIARIAGKHVERLRDAYRGSAHLPSD